MPKTIALFVLAGAVVCAGLGVPLAAGLGGTAPKNVTPPVVTGSPVQGQTLSTTNGVWTGSQPMTFTYQWLRCKPGSSCTAIVGATKTTYLLGAADVGSTVASVVSARNVFGHASAQSVAVGPVTSGGGGVQTGASKATCSTNPCKAGVVPNGAGQNGCTAGTFATNIVALGKISNGAATECRLYGYYKPANLSGAAPAVLIAPGANGLCGGNDVGQVFKDSNWQSVADSNRLVLILLAKASSPTCRGAWYHPNIDVPAPESSGSDEPYIARVVSDATSRLGLDVQRLYLTGASSGASLTYDVACDPVNSLKFRGFTAISGLMQAKKSGSNFVSGTERCATANTNFFIQNVHGTNDGNVPFGGDCSPSNHCVVSFAENARWWAQHMGCGPTPKVTMFGSPSASNEKDDYQGCAFGSPAVSYESVKVQNGCHAWEGLDAHPANPSTCSGHASTNNTNGFYTAQTNWDWFSTRSWIG